MNSICVDCGMTIEACRCKELRKKHKVTNTFHSGTIILNGVDTFPLLGMQLVSTSGGVMTFAMTGHVPRTRCPTCGKFAIKENISVSEIMDEGDFEYGTFKIWGISEKEIIICKSCLDKR